MLRSLINVGMLLFLLILGGNSNAGPSSIFSRIVLPAHPGNERNSDGDIVKLKDGRLLLAWDDFYTNDSSDWGPAQIAAVTSADGGRSWHNKVILQPHLSQMDSLMPSLLQLQSGKLLFVFLRVDDSKRLSQPMFRISTDDAKTFSKPKPITVDPYRAYYTLNSDRVIQLRSGRILVPVAFTRDLGLAPRVFSQVYYSDDEGKTWRGSRVIRLQGGKVEGLEPGVVELGDGRVMLWLRTGGGHPFHCYSSDGGETWSSPAPMNVVASDSPESIKRIPSTGDLLMVWDDSPRYRFPLSTAISKDGGYTWLHIKNLDDDPAHTYAYPSIDFEGQHVFVTYYMGAPIENPCNPTYPNWSLKLRVVQVKSLYQ